MRRPKQQYMNEDLEEQILDILEYAHHMGMSFAQVKRAFIQIMRGTKGAVLDEN